MGKKAAQLIAIPMTYTITAVCHKDKKMYLKGVMCIFILHRGSN